MPHRIHYIGQSNAARTRTIERECAKLDLPAVVRSIAARARTRTSK